MNAINYNKQNKPKYHEQTRTNQALEKEWRENQDGAELQDLIRLKKF